MSSYILNESQLQFFKKNGFIILKNFLTNAHASEIKSFVLDLANWPETPNKWMRYYETNTKNQKSLCRIENFLDYHEPLKHFLTGKTILQILKQLAGEDMIIFKEKINFKYPGGKGFLAHQDAPAFMSFGQKYHITMLISIDDSTKENGCLEMVQNHGQEELLAQSPGGILSPKVVEKLEWTPIETTFRDLVLFNSYVPHRSQDNLSSFPRRALYITYNRLSDGDVRAKYFKDKREKFPPECERIAGKDYSLHQNIYNLANPIK